MKQRTSMQKLAQFFSLMKYDKKDYILYFIQSLIKGFNPLIHIIFIEKIVSALTQKNSILLEKTLLYYIGFLMIYEFVRFLTRNFGWVVTIAKCDKNIYEMYLKKFVQMDNNEVEKIGVGKMIAILENGRLRWGEGLSMSIEKGTALFLLLIYVFFVTFHHGVGYTVAFFTLLVLSVLILAFVNRYQFRFRSKRSELRNDRLRLITKILMSKNEILQTNKIDNEVNKIEQYCQEMGQINILMSNGRFVQYRAIQFGIGISLFMFIFVFSQYVFSGEMELSQFVGITSIFLVINGVVSNFVSFYIDLTKDFIDIEKMWDFFENTPSLSGYNEGETFHHKKGDINLKNISYSYNKGKNVFQDFFLDIQGGKITAFVGSSGGGKTTLVKLLAGYIRQDAGDIIIDGQNIKNISLKSYYQDIGYLSQEPSIFDGSILDNLIYAVDREVSQNELNKIIILAKCEFIFELLNGLQTEIGERGVKLSGGQKQRLAIAKIMLKNPKIIFLDEPTSALDSFSEEQITKAMHNLFQNRTVIIIAHRLQTVKHADRIIVIENGKITEEGNHKTLIYKNGIYKKMLDLQSGF